MSAKLQTELKGISAEIDRLNAKFQKATGDARSNLEAALVPRQAREEKRL